MGKFNKENNELITGKLNVTTNLREIALPDRFKHVGLYNFLTGGPGMLENNEFPNQEMIIVLDFDGQYNQHIARKIQAMGVHSKLYSYKVTAKEVKKLNPKGIILSGGSKHVHSDNAYTIDKEIFNLGIPILGICYGMQLLAVRFGGQVRRREERMYGEAAIQIKGGGPELFKGIPEKLDVWMSFGDTIKEMPAGFVIDAESKEVPIAAISNTDSKLYGIQFHPEVAQTERGTELLKNFVFGLCNCLETR